MIKFQQVIILRNKNISNLIFRYIDKNLEYITPDRKRLQDYLLMTGAE